MLNDHPMMPFTFSSRVFAGIDDLTNVLSAASLGYDMANSGKNGGREFCAGALSAAASRPSP